VEDGQEIIDIQDEGRLVFLYHLGDHDPSAVGAWQDFTRKVTGFCEEESWPPHFERLAVTREQIASLELPTRPTKANDPRSARWQGGGSVEVDAIRAPVLRAIVENAIMRHIDRDQLEITKRVEEQERAGLLALRNGMRG
jgi:hypothetical protein